MPREKNPPSDRASEIRAELIRTISAFVGSAESRPTGIPGLALYRHTSPTASSPVTFEPSVAVVVQGRKRVELRQNAFTYDPSRFLLTSLGLPVVSRVIEASETTPYLCMVLQLEIPVVRELLNREEVQPSEAPPDSLAMATGDISTELLDAFRRLIYLLDTPRDIPFFEGMIKREIVYRILHGPAGARLRAIATLGDQSNRTAKAIALIRANYAKPLRVDELAAAAGMGVSTFHRHFQGVDRNESRSVSEAASVAGSAETHAGRARRYRCGLLKSDMEAPANSLASTAASLGSLRREIFNPSALPNIRQ